MFGPVVTTEAHLPFSGARTHSNNTAEMTATILSFLGPHAPVTRDEQSCIYYDSMHAAGICHFCFFQQFSTFFYTFLYIYHFINIFTSLIFLYNFCLFLTFF